MGSQRKKVPNIFLDSNIYIAAALSNRGGSFRILQEAKNDTVKIYTSAFVMQEIARTIKRKYPQKLEYTTALISSTPLQFKKQPGVKEVQKLSSLIEDPNDAPILAAALKNKVTYLSLWIVNISSLQSFKTQTSPLKSSPRRISSKTIFTSGKTHWVNLINTL